jgi:hypothetical protein
MSQSQISRISAGAINKVNDAVVGMPAAPFGPGTSQFAGQLGKRLLLDQDEVIFDSAMGTVYGGEFQYVRLASTALAVVVGQLVFWDPSAADQNLFVTTTSESGSTDAAVLVAGVVLNSGWTPGNYSWIQIQGRVPVKFRAALTSAGAIGSPVYAAAVGGADLGFADVIETGTASTFSDVTLLQRRFLGEAYVAPTNGSLTDVTVRTQNWRS